VSEVWVLNASPIVTLAKIGQLRLIESLVSDWIVPEAVATEVLAGPPDDPARIAIAGGWGRQCAPTSISDAVIEWGLGSGETAVLALSLEHQPAIAVLDDAAARAAARALGVPLIGTLGVIVRAKLRGLLPAAGPVLANLRAAGLRLDDRLIRTTLQGIGEPPP
jgi:predicted nucleic acid-binding protein